MTASKKLLESIRNIAGITESYDDEDDDVRAAEQELKKIDKKNPKAAAAGAQAEKAAKKVDADKDLSQIEKKAKAKADEPAKEAKQAKTEDKPAGKGTFSSIAKPLLKAGKSTADIRAALAAAGISVNHIHSRLHGLKKGLKEGFVLVHPSLPSFVLAENSMMNQYQWISEKEDTSSLHPMVFEDTASAQKVMKYLSEYKNQDAILTPIKVEM